jgi:hypothetical protein
MELFEHNKKKGGGFFVDDFVFPFSKMVGGFHNVDSRELHYPQGNTVGISLH